MNLEDKEDKHTVPTFLESFHDVVNKKRDSKLITNETELKEYLLAHMNEENGGVELFPPEIKIQNITDPTCLYLMKHRYSRLRNLTRPEKQLLKRYIDDITNSNDPDFLYVNMRRHGILSKDSKKIQRRLIEMKYPRMIAHITVEKLQELEEKKEKNNFLSSIFYLRTKRDRINVVDDVDEVPNEEDDKNTDIINFNRQKQIKISYICY